jgi:hypothetical protein
MWKDSHKYNEANGWDMGTNLAIKGEPAPRFAIYVCNLDDEPCQRVAEYSRISDVLGRKRRFDQVIKIRVGADFLTWPEFVEWSRTQEGA